MPTNQNYVIGRGRIYLDRFPNATTYVGTGERYLGNTPSLSVTSAVTNLDHFSSEKGLKVKDRSVVLQHDESGSFSTDNIDIETVALWFSGTNTVAAQTETAGERFSESFTVQPGLFYQIGTSVAKPAGKTDLVRIYAATGVSVVAATGTLTFSAGGTAADTIVINGVTITLRAVPATQYEALASASAAGTAQGVAAKINALTGIFKVSATRADTVLTLTAIAPGTGGNSITTTEVGTATSFGGATLSGGVGTPMRVDFDWTIDALTGRFNILAGGAATAGTNVKVSYATVAVSTDIMVSGGTEVYGALRFVADNAEGKNTDYFWPYVKLTPSGDFALKGDDWQVLTMGFEVLTLTDRASVYVRQRRATGSLPSMGDEPEPPAG